MAPPLKATPLRWMFGKRRPLSQPRLRAVENQGMFGFRYLRGVEWPVADIMFRPNIDSNRHSSILPGKKSAPACPCLPLDVLIYAFHSKCCRCSFYMIRLGLVSCSCAWKYDMVSLTAQPFDRQDGNSIFCLFWFLPWVGVATARVAMAGATRRWWWWLGARARARQAVQFVLCHRLNCNEMC